jgi:para-nitrobenzyl esterase
MTEVSKFSEASLTQRPQGYRWAAPQPPAPWSGVLDAFQARTPCPQTGQYASLDEDCLYLNVFVPFRYANNKLPVMVWIHPGGQTSSAANDWPSITVDGNMSKVVLGAG